MKDNSAIWAVACLIALIAGGLIGALTLSSTEIVSVDVPQIVYVEQNSSVQEEAANKILEEDNFEAWAIDLAMDDLEYRDYKDLYKFLEANVDIVDDDDLGNVLIKDTDVSGVDVDDEDANVEFELKVYYEDSDGDDKKVYVNVEYIIEDGEVDDVIFSLA